MEKTLGQIMQEKREALGLNVSEMSRKAGLSTTQIDNYENDNVKKPQRRTAIKLAEAYGFENYLEIFSYFENANHAIIDEKLKRRISDLFEKSSLGKVPLIALLTDFCDAVEHSPEIMREVVTTVCEAEDKKRQKAQQVLKK